MKTNKYPLFFPHTDEPKHSAESGLPTAIRKKQSNTNDAKSIEIPVDEPIEDPAEEPIEESVEESTKPNSNTNWEIKEHTRGKMASLFVLGFFTVVILCFVYAAWKQEPLVEVKEMITAVIGALSGLIGFVIGYYFKTKD
jgi:hypothetical protein